MRLQYIELQNFRSFFERTRIDFSQDEEKNITVVHGVNGSGKTTILNAFKWCFYENTDFDEDSTNLINLASVEAADRGDLLHLYVEIGFVYEGTSYVARRKESHRKTGDLQSETVTRADMELTRIDTESGNSHIVESPNVHLSAILPEQLQPYFFFNGERIEKIAGLNSSHLVQSAIRKLIGLEIVARAIRHSGSVSNKLRRKLKSKVGSKHKKVLDQISILEEDMQAISDNLERNNAAVESKQFDLSKLNQALREHDKSKQYQEQREQKSELREELTNQKDKYYQDKKKLTSRLAVYALSDGLFDKCSEIIDENRKKGVLPFGIKEQFIDDLIERGLCICGSEITKGGGLHRNLVESKEASGDDASESNYTLLSGFLSTVSQNRESFFSEQKNVSGEISRLHKKIKKLDAEIADISAKIIHQSDSEVIKLEKDRSNLEKLVNGLNRTIAILEEKLESMKAKSDELKREEKLLSEKTNEYDTFAAAYDLSERLTEIFTNLRHSVDTRVRKQLSDRVGEIFGEIIRANYRARISSDFKLELIRIAGNGEEVPWTGMQSTGESQITSLSFISAIISIAKEKFENKTSKYFRSGLYPLVMDSPFGALDPDYRKKVADKISIFADQVVILVSQSQWRGEVEEACGPRVGKEYKLKLYTSDSERKGQEDVVITESGGDYTVIEEILK